MKMDQTQFYLWHLAHIGVLQNADGGWTSPLWTAAKDAEEAGNAVTVALIDSGIDPHHPNLETALDGPQVDFAPRVSGAVYAPHGEALKTLQSGNALSPDKIRDLAANALQDASAYIRAMGLNEATLTSLHDAIQNAPDPQTEVAAFLNAFKTVPSAPEPAGFQNIDGQLSALSLSPTDEATLKSMADQMNAGFHQIDTPDSSAFFGNHGTACAGLVAGRPPTSRPHAFFSALPYYGVNPHCRLRSYATPYSHEFKPVCHAVLAAYLSGAEVILIPRGVPDVAGRKSLPPSPRRGTRIDTPSCDSDDDLYVPEDQALLGRLEDDQRLLITLIQAIAKQRYVVLAAGNDGTPKNLGHPAAALSDTDDVIIVGAVNKKGYRSSYSNGLENTDRVLYFVSDDAPVFSRDDVRIDPNERTTHDFDYAPHADVDDVDAFSPWAPLSLDVRGSYGFSASAGLNPPEHDSGIDVASLYTLFGGTSAASSIAAGAISLLIQTNDLPRTPSGGYTAIKDALEVKGIKTGLMH